MTILKESGGLPSSHIFSGVRKRDDEDSGSDRGSAGGGSRKERDERLAKRMRGVSLKDRSRLE